VGPKVRKRVLHYVGEHLNVDPVFERGEVVIVTISLNYHFQGDASEGDRATPRDPSGSLGLVADYLNLSLIKQGHPSSRGTVLTSN
jgi:hypothetical protein